MSDTSNNTDYHSINSTEYHSINCDIHFEDEPFRPNILFILVHTSITCGLVILLVVILFTFITCVKVSTNVL